MSHVNLGLYIYFDQSMDLDLAFVAGKVVATTSHFTGLSLVLSATARLCYQREATN